MRNLKILQLFVLLIILVAFTACNPAINRKELDLVAFWDGYVHQLSDKAPLIPSTIDPLLSTKLLSVAVINNTLYVSSRVGLQAKPISEIIKDGKVLSTSKHGQWPEVKYNGSSILGVTDIYDDAANSRIFIASNQGVFYKSYSEADTEFKKIIQPTFLAKDIETMTLTSADVSAFKIFVDDANVIYVASTTGLYISTDLATWRNICGRKIMTIGDNYLYDLPRFKIADADIDYKPYVMGIPPALDTASNQTIDTNDYANPSNRTTGVVRVFPYYKDTAIKASIVKDVCVYNNKIFLATDCGGVSFAAKPSTIMTDPFVWETYMNPSSAYKSSNYKVTDALGRESGQSINNNEAICVSANNKGIFMGKQGGGISIGYNYTEASVFLTADGCRMDKSGNVEFTKNDQGDFVVKNPLFKPDLDKTNGDSEDNTTKVQRINWREFTDGGWEVFTPVGSIAPIKPAGFQLPNNRVFRMRFGLLGQREMIYVATDAGLGVAELRVSYNMNEKYNAVPELYTGEPMYNIEFQNWGHYYKDPTQIGELTRPRDVFVTQTKVGEAFYDEYVWVTTDGNGLILYKWNTEHMF